MYDTDQTNRLSWLRNDMETMLGVRGGRFTAVNSGLCAGFAFAATILFYAFLYLLSGTWISELFTNRGFTPYPMTFLAFWSVAILFFKWTKIRLQRKALDVTILPHATFILSPNTVDQVLHNINLSVEQPKQFFLFNRIIGALSNLKNIGMISDVSDILRSYNEQDAETVETSYSLLVGFIWAIPVLGFIGTVEGLSKAIGAFTSVLQDAGDIGELTGSLQDVTSGLAIAFDTTLIALVIALFLHIFATTTRKNEDELLHSCSEYCNQNVVARLRMTINREE